MEEQKYLITDHTFIRFAIIGVISNVINFTLYALTYLIFVNIIISSLIGYFIGILTSYYFGRLWVFKVDNNFTLSEIIRFVSVYVIGGLGMTIIIFCLDYYLNLKDNILLKYGHICDQKTGIKGGRGSWDIRKQPQ